MTRLQCRSIALTLLWASLFLFGPVLALVTPTTTIATRRTMSPWTRGSSVPMASSSFLLRRTTTTATTATTTTSRKMMNLEDWVYHAGSAASHFASDSLKDPTSTSWTSLPIMYGAGLLTSVSPCVWGLLPLTMSYISTAAGERNDKKATLPTLAFAAGLALVFCTLGWIAASVGGVLGGSGGTNSDQRDIIVALLSSGVCLVMGLQLLDLIALPRWDIPTQLPRMPWDKELPKAVTTTEILLDEKGFFLSSDDSSSSSSSSVQRQQQGSLLRTFLLGGSSALVASPCATPVLTSILAYVANAPNPWWGPFLLLGYTLGYSTPLLVVAATGGQALARLKGEDGSGSIYAQIAPWVTPLTAGILLWYGTTGLLTTLGGDPSLAGLAPILE